MKKAFLIGKFNQITREISACLSSQCQVQLCSDNREILKGMLQMTSPDLIVVLLPGISLTLDDLFSLLFKKCSKIPLVVIGNQGNRDTLSTKGYLSGEQIHFLRSPVNLEEISACVEGLFKPEQEREEGAEQAQAVILLVDDSPSLLRTMQAILSRKYRVTFATSGTQAIASIAKNRPDLILLDYEMPVCDGKMTLQMLRSEESTRDIPVVFLTGIADSEHVMEVMSLNPQGYLLKPCTEERLFSTIESVLAESGEKKDGNPS